MLGNNSDCPCNGCVPPKRNATCHPTCKEYIEWREEQDIKNAKIYREKKAFQDILSCVRKNSVMKRKKKEPWGSWSQ